MKRAGRRDSRPVRVAGISIVELMVCLAVGLVVMLAVSHVLISSEGRKRTTMTVDDSQQAGAQVAHLLTQAMASAGSGFHQRWQDTFGCPLRASHRSGGSLLPRTGGWPAPFTRWPAGLVLAPVLVGKDLAETGSDVIVTMAGAAGFGESPFFIIEQMSQAVRLPTSWGLRPDDLVLKVRPGDVCELDQIDAAFAAGGETVVPFGGPMHAGAQQEQPGTQTPTGQRAFLVGLGRAGAVDGGPQFRMFGVAAAGALVSLDLLRPRADAVPETVADGVVVLRAVYGVDQDGDGAVDAWVDPGTAPYDFATLSSGDAGSRRVLRSIAAVRVGLVLRDTLRERQPVAPESLALFKGLAGDALVERRNLSPEERHFRHRTLEWTVPLRNVLLLP